MKKIHCIYYLLTLLLIAACASIGEPDGGIYDEVPPRMISSYPALGATMSHSKKISILFNEYIKLENANEKVIISPPQEESANVRADGKRIKITLFDTLQANTTYTIDFSDAIQDNNEGNPMGHFTYSFSTGETIDTMEVAGTVLNAADLEPVKGIMVGLYPADSTFHDSLLTTKPFTRISRTNGSGRFCIKGVKNGRYRVFALKDVDGDMVFSQKSEIVAFDTLVVETSSKPDVRMDTIWRDSTHYDSIRVIPYTHYLPDDVVLLSFQEELTEQHLLKTERTEPDFFRLYFTAKADTLPTIVGLNFDERCLVAEPTTYNDTITYWVTDTTFTHQQDTLTFALTYLETDTLGQLVPRTDTLNVVPKTTYAKIRKEEQKKIDDWEKDREKRQRRSKTPLPDEKNPYTQHFMEISVKPSSGIDPNKNVTFTSKEPFLNVDTTRIHFYLKKDTDLIPEPFLFLPDESIRSYTLYAEWEPEHEYVFRADSAAFTNVFGIVSKEMKNTFKVFSLEEYGAIFVNTILPDTGVIVELMNRSDKPVARMRADADGRADFYYVKPGEYYLRCFIDRNGNDKWDTGNYAEGLQPEEVFYFPKPLNFKAQWDLEQDWNVRSIPREKQKPEVITKQKPDKEKSIKSRNREREERKRNGGNASEQNNSRQGSSSSFMPGGSGSFIPGR